MQCMITDFVWIPIWFRILTVGMIVAITFLFLVSVVIRKKSIAYTGMVSSTLLFSTVLLAGLRAKIMFSPRHDWYLIFDYFNEWTFSALSLFIATGFIFWWSYILTLMYQVEKYQEDNPS